MTVIIINLYRDASLTALILFIIVILFPVSGTHILKSNITNYEPFVY